MRRHHQISARPRQGAPKPKVATRLTTRVVVFVIALGIGLLGATLACRADNPIQDEPTAAAKAEPLSPGNEMDLDTSVRRPPPNLAPIVIKRGTEYQFNCKSNTVWILIPSPHFSKVSGGSDWAIGEEMIAFKIDHGSARIKLSEDFPPSTEETTIFYSILFFDGEGYYYQHGESPPTMIIPPSPPLPQ